MYQYAQKRVQGEGKVVFRSRHRQTSPAMIEATISSKYKPVSVIAWSQKRTSKRKDSAIKSDAT